MADMKITALAAASTPLAGSEQLELVQGGYSVKVSASDVGNSANALPYNSLSGRAYISAHSTADQTGSTSAGTAIAFPTTGFSSGISMVTNGTALTRVTFAAAGTYAIMPNLQFANSAAADYVATIWFRKNGTDIANSATAMSVPKIGDGGSAFFQIVFYEQVTAGQYIEVVWMPSNAAVTLDYVAATASAPAIPSAILTAERIA